jgi:hypothetical protein
VAIGSSVAWLMTMVMKSMLPSPAAKTPIRDI